MKPSIGLIDAGGANLGSVHYALERLDAAVTIIRAPDELDNISHLILPGVGAACEGMRRLNDQGLTPVLRNWDRPLLGICLGMQLLFEHCEEDDTPGLGLLPGRVTRLAVASAARVPHMGWNTLRILRSTTLLDGIADGAYAYFVHSYAAPLSEATIASCQHGDTEFAAVVQHGCLYGAQFHPERSADTGARVLHNFLKSTEP